MSEIKAACPFCGSHRLKVKPVWDKYRFVACLDCKGAGPVSRSEEGAILLFERRSEPQPVQGRLL